jgi:hypothetical protein
MAKMRKEHCCSVTLNVVGVDLEPNVVTSCLGWSPDQSWRRGERKRFMRPDGTERVFDSVHDRGGWKQFTAEDERGQSLEEQFAAWLERLRLKGQEIQRLHDHGWEIELDCFAATSECLDLPAAMIKEMAGLGIGLALTFSANTDEDSADAPDPASES